MGKETETGFLDLWDIDHTKFQEKPTEEPEIKGDEEEPVKEGTPGVTDVTEEPEEDIDVDSDPGEGPEPKGDEKQAEEEEEGKEDASSKGKGEDSKPEKNENVEETELDTVFQELVEDELVIYDEEKEYEVSSAGIKELIKETVEKKSAEAVENFKNSLPEKASELLKILEKGGTVEDYISLDQEYDYNKIPIEDKEGNPILQNQLNLIEDWMKIQKYTDEEIKDTLEDYQSSGIIKKQAEIARKKLASHQEEKNQALITQREEEKAARDKQQEEAATAFKETVLGAKDIAGFKITKDKAQKLYDFITKPNKEGKTQFQLTDTEQNRLLYAYMAMEGFDKEKLVKEAATKQALKLKKKLSTFKDKQAAPKRGASDVRRTETKDIVDGINWIV